MKPIIVNSPDPMVKVRVMTTKDCSTDALKTLHRLGVLHVEESDELKPVDREAIERERRQVDELLRDIDDVLACIPKGEKVSLEEDTEVIYSRPFSEIDSEIRLLCTKLSNMQRRVVKLSEEVRELTELSRYLGHLGQQIEIKLKDLNFSGGYLFSRIFLFPSELPETLYHSIKHYLFGSTVVTLENETIFYAIAKIEDQKNIESTVKDGGGNILRIPDEDLTIGEFLEVSRGKTCELEEELTKLREEMEGKTRENLEKLVLFKEALSAENDRLLVLEQASEARFVTLIEGWIPESGDEETVSEIKEDIDYAFIDIRKPEQIEEPPTNLRNVSALKPFQIIVNLFGTPKYREWDPTPIIAYSFAFFFGLMMGDVVYATLIMLFAKFGLRLFVDDPESEGFKSFQRVLYISSSVALVIGFLTGSYLGNFLYEFFGIKNLAIAPGLEAILVNPMSFIVLSLIIGLIHVNIAHILGLIRGIKERQRGVAIGKAGLFILQIAGIPWIMHAILHVDIPLFTAQTYSILLYVIALSLILIIASSIIQKGAFMGGIFWLFDVTGLLGDVMSYARLAGVSLATYYLAVSFNLMATLVLGAASGNIALVIGATILTIIILLIGHLLNLVLAGITCFVHSLRLCFVEFLFKFYEGGGREYSPFRLRRRSLSVKVNT